MDVPRRVRGENRAKTTLFALFTGGVAGSPIARFILAPPPRSEPVGIYTYTGTDYLHGCQRRVSRLLMNWMSATGANSPSLRVGSGRWREPFFAVLK